MCFGSGPKLVDGETLQTVFGAQLHHMDCVEVTAVWNLVAGKEEVGKDGHTDMTTGCIQNTPEADMCKVMLEEFNHMCRLMQEQFSQFVRKREAGPRPMLTSSFSQYPYSDVVYCGSVSHHHHLGGFQDFNLSPSHHSRVEWGTTPLTYGLPPPPGL